MMNYICRCARGIPLPPSGFSLLPSPFPILPPHSNLGARSPVQVAAMNLHLEARTLTVPRDIAPATSDTADALL
ncbi:MAG TPA: hypothetical protein VMJ30_00860, partial [Gemmatimonadales bacterium]|nr:hypothetical protein [Gemmatimonadales bacterium]